MRDFLAGIALLALPSAASAQFEAPPLPQQQQTPAPLPNANGTSGSEQRITPLGTIAGTPVAPAASAPPRCLASSMTSTCARPPTPPCLPGQRLPGTACVPDPTKP